MTLNRRIIISALVAFSSILGIANASKHKPLRMGVAEARQKYESLQTTKTQKKPNENSHKNKMEADSNLDLTPIMPNTDPVVIDTAESNGFKTVDKKAGKYTLKTFTTNEGVIRISGCLCDNKQVALTKAVVEAIKQAGIEEINTILEDNKIDEQK